jgi:hypothetical protein
VQQSPVVNWRRIGAGVGDGDGVADGVDVAVAVPVCVGEGNGVREAIGTTLLGVGGDSELTAVAVGVEATACTWAVELADRDSMCKTGGSVALAELQPAIATKSDKAERNTHVACFGRISTWILITAHSGQAAKD